MSFDGIVTGAVTRQLQEKLTGGKIEKIYQPEADEIILYIHAGKEKYRLYISSNSSHARIHLIDATGANPQNPMGFCMLLRKHLQGGRISTISQKDSERIVEISVSTINELGFSVNKKLVVEIMGKHSNIILLDAESNRILDSIKRISIDVNRYRQLLPGQTYVYPPAHDKASYYHIDENTFADFPGENPEAAAKYLLSHIQGISPVIGEEIANQVISNSSPSADSLTWRDYYKVLQEMLRQMDKGDIKVMVYLDKENHPVDFHVFPLHILTGPYQEITFEDVSEGIAYFYANKNSSNRVKQRAMDLEKAVGNNLEKMYLKKQRLSEDLIRAEQGEVYRLYGELITANLHNIQSGDTTVTLLNYYDNQMLTIPIETRYSPSQNAQRYYKKYSKAKTAITEKNIQLQETNGDISYLESVLSFIEGAQTIEEIEELRQELVEGGFLKKRKNNYKPTKSKPAPYSYRTSQGFKVLVGRNNKENDLLTFKMASGKDLWFHTKDIPGSHVILMTEGQRVTEEAIFEAAALAAYHSKGKTSENVPVDYTQVRYVKKPSGAKPGMVIFTDNRTVYVNPAVLPLEN